MKINDSYSLKIDKIGTYILTYNYISLNQTYAVKDIGYYPNIEQALAGCLKHGIIGTDLEDVERICKKLDTINKDIKKFLKNNYYKDKKLEG